MPDQIAAFSTDIEAPRFLSVDTDYYSNFIHEDLLARETELFKTKWFDYRFMTPLQATALYVDEYNLAFKRIYARQFDRDRAEHFKLPNLAEVIARFAGDDNTAAAESLPCGVAIAASKRTASEEKKAITRQKVAKENFHGFWNGRQVADFIGIPYNHYLDLALDYRMRRWKQGFVPRPQLLYHEYDVEKICDKWTEMQAGEIFTANHSAYLVQNYQGVKAQDDYHEWLFAQAMSRASAYTYLAQFVDEDRLPIEKVRARLDDRAYERFERELQQSH
jgi:hypothetical protein